MRNYVIIGGSSGIGKALVEVLQNNTDNQQFVSYNKNQIENSSGVHYFPFDVTKDELDLDLLPNTIHGLVYCPGSIHLKPFHRFTESDFLTDFQLQVLGATKVIKQLLPRLKQSGDASIVLFSTIAVQRGFNFHAQVGISKGAIEGLTRSLAAEFAPVIRVNAVAPSLTDTPLASKLLNTPEKVMHQADNNPLKRVGNATEIAEAVAYLLTPKSSWTTGQILHIDGGYSMLK